MNRVWNVGDADDMISRNESPDTILSIMNAGNIKADDTDNRPYRSGNTPLHYAAMRGSTDLAEMFLDKHTINVNVLNRLLQPPICCAILFDRIEFVRVLLKHGATVTDSVFNFMLIQNPGNIISNELIWMITREAARTGTIRKRDPLTSRAEHELLSFAAVPAEQLLIQRQDEPPAEQEFSNAKPGTRLWREAAAMQRKIIYLEAGTGREP